jgi:hypothetical protein
MTSAAAPQSLGTAGLDQPAAPVHPERTIYAASGARKTMISFLFLLLLPFFASLPAMLGMRISHGLWGDAIGLGVMALAFLAVMFLLLVNLMFSLRARVQLGEKSLRLTLPTGRGPTPMLRYRTAEIAYSDIAAVETRREIYGGALAPVLLSGARIVKKDGTSVQLGYDADSNPDQAFPYVEIAHNIAKHAGLTVQDKGHVRRSLTSKVMGIASTGDSATVDAAEIARLNGAHRRFVLALVLLLTALVVTGIAMDLFNPPSSSSAVVEGVEKPKKPR